MPIVYDIEPEADDESAYRCWSCGALLDVLSASQRLDRRCAHCCEAEHEAVSAAVQFTNDEALLARQLLVEHRMRMLMALREPPPKSPLTPHGRAQYAADAALAASALAKLLDIQVAA
jgi:hypothetical protein